MKVLYIEPVNSVLIRGSVSFKGCFLSMALNN